MSRVFENKFKIKYDWFIYSLEIVNTKSQNSGVISSRLRKLEGYYMLLTEAYESILNVCTEKDDSDVIKEYDGKYREATEIYNKLEAISAAYPSLDGTYKPTESAPLARLPRIDLTTFNGDLFSWSSFISLFHSLVLSRKDISKTEKFHYLISHVEGEPRSLIQHLPMVDVSLDTALDILKARFENKRLLTDSHIYRILHLPVLTKAVGLRTKLLNPLLESTRALNNLGLPTGEWSYILLYIGLSKLPIEIKTRFEQKYGGNSINLPTFDQLIEFLQNECRFIDTAASVAGAAMEPVSYAERTRRTADKRNIHLTQNNNGIRTERANYKQCCYCQCPGHTVIECFKFGNLTRQDRKGWIQVNGLCFKCFGRHSAASCRAAVVPCGQCGNPGHNELICTFIARSNSPVDGGQRTRHAHVAARDDGDYGRHSPCESRRSVSISRGYAGRTYYQRRRSDSGHNTDDRAYGNNSRGNNGQDNRASSPPPVNRYQHNNNSE